MNLHGLLASTIPHRGAVTLRVPASGDIKAAVIEAVEQVREAVVLAYGVGRFVAPLEQVPCRFVGDLVELKVTVETPDGGRLLIAEIERRQRLRQTLTHITARGPQE